MILFNKGCLGADISVHVKNYFSAFYSTAMYICESSFFRNSQSLSGLKGYKSTSR